MTLQIRVGGRVRQSHRPQEEEEANGGSEDGDEDESDAEEEEEEEDGRRRRRLVLSAEGEARIARAARLIGRAFNLEVSQIIQRMEEAVLCCAVLCCAVAMAAGSAR